jgi:hypothetical protein
VILAALFALTQVGQSGALIDKKSGRLEAEAAAAADLRAPSAGVARIKAERTARARAEKKLEAALRHLKCKLDEPALRKALESAEVADVTWGSDGSVQLKLTLDTRPLSCG